MRSARLTERSWSDDSAPAKGKIATASLRIVSVCCSRIRAAWERSCTFSVSVDSNAAMMANGVRLYRTNSLLSSLPKHLSWRVFFSPAILQAGWGVFDYRWTLDRPKRRGAQITFLGDY